MANEGDGVQVEGIAQIALTVTDLEEAKAFYRDVLGMRFSFEAGNMVFFRCGDVRLMIGASDRTLPGGGTIVYFRVPDLDVSFLTLQRQGVEIVQEPHLVARMKGYDLWLAFVKDPAGNTLGLMCERPKSEGSEPPVTH